jgi:hypothetical protein
MKLLSFDVGIRNLAMCMFSQPTVEANNQLTIDQWGIIDLLSDDEPRETQTCQQANKNGPMGRCTKEATYSHTSNGCTSLYCNTHAKKSPWIFPQKKHTTPALRKLTLPKLKEMAASLQLPPLASHTSITKANLLDQITAYVAANTLTSLETAKVLAKDLSLVELGRRMAAKLDLVEGISEVTHVIIENQIAPLANRMAIIQGMITAYFILRNPATVIEHISSINKLKALQPKVPTGQPKHTYKENKQNSITFCEKCIQEKFPNWLTLFQSHRKRDDLADCFLQGIWYLGNQGSAGSLPRPNTHINNISLS